MSAGSATTEQPRPSPPRILLMEDEANVARGLKLVLGEAGYEVDWAENGKSALELVQCRFYDLILADLCLPDLDGMEIIKEVRQRRPQISIIVITGYATVASAIDAFKLGTADYLEKPFTDSEITAAVNRVLVTGSAKVPEF
jgi:DNA-binding response OmpR family regulator